MFSFILRWLGVPEWEIQGYTSEFAYTRINDPRISVKACSVKDYYVGYPFVVKCPYDSKIGKLFNNHYFTYQDTIDQWMQGNNVRNYRTDIHRVIYHNGCDVFNEIGGTDHLYAAFTNEQDAIWFSLTWC